MFPTRQETIVLPYNAEKAVGLIDEVTIPVSRVVKKNRPSILFNGSINEDSFVISRKIDYPQNFLPLIYGHLENTGLGSIIFLRYKLFFSSKMFLTFWSVLSILITLFLIIYYQEYNYATISIIAGATNYLVSYLNFRKQISESRNALLRALKLA